MDILIDYGGLYGVKPGETDFSGAIQRSLKEGVKHVYSEELLSYIKDRKKNKKS